MHPRLGQDSAAQGCGSDVFDKVVREIEESPRTWIALDGVGGGWKRWQAREFGWWATQMARPAPLPSRYFVPGLPHVILIELRQALISYQDYHVLAREGILDACCHAVLL